LKAFRNFHKDPWKLWLETFTNPCKISLEFFEVSRRQQTHPWVVPLGTTWKNG
jgi:hypothetical protein